VTAFLGLGLFIGGFWLIVKHPKSALKCVFWAGVLSLLLVSDGIGDGNPIQHPFIGLVAIVIGCMCAPDKSTDRKHTNKEAGK
jgi:hypothetical protein